MLRSNKNIGVEIIIFVDIIRVIVVEKFVEVGVNLINDIFVGIYDDEMFFVVVVLKVLIILMYICGILKIM